ncbi:zinc-ribbon domain-containing protein [Qiania dongpingensis]|uniref:zinc-ribbon domain-containing protein n=1 Tax=Qiania dongpingensis TaxID=2763669 RepID=UPI00201659F1|nr:zinc ribbon domain-containing protein [Qiania dongpingensis]
MALIKCPECGKEVSDKAAACPNCGFPLDLYAEAKRDNKADSNCHDKYGRFSNKESKIKASREKLQEALNKQTRSYHSQASCPRCGSTSITYTNKRLSIGRAMAGGVLAGPAGSVMGGLSSKKGYAVCLSCGKKWKV